MASAVARKSTRVSPARPEDAEAKSYPAPDRLHSTGAKTYLRPFGSGWNSCQPSERAVNGTSPSGLSSQS